MAFVKAHFCTSKYLLQVPCSLYSQYWYQQEEIPQSSQVAWIEQNAWNYSSNPAFSKVIAINLPNTFQTSILWQSIALVIPNGKDCNLCLLCINQRDVLKNVNLEKMNMIQHCILIFSLESTYVTKQSKELDASMRPLLLADAALQIRDLLSNVVCHSVD